MLHSRRLRQTPGNQGDADGAIAPAPGIQDAPLSDVPATVDPPDPGAPANITIVRTAQDLQRATATGAVDIEIRAHLDLRSLSRTLNPAIPGSETFQNPKRNALLYAQSPLRSIRVRCDRGTGPSPEPFHPCQRDCFCQPALSLVFDLPRMCAAASRDRAILFARPRTVYAAMWPIVSRLQWWPALIPRSPVS